MTAPSEVKNYALPYRWCAFCRTPFMTYLKSCDECDCPECGKFTRHRKMNAPEYYAALVAYESRLEKKLKHAREEKESLVPEIKLTLEYMSSPTFQLPGGATLYLKRDVDLHVNVSEAQAIDLLNVKGLDSFVRQVIVKKTTLARYMVKHKLDLAPHLTAVPRFIVNIRRRNGKNDSSAE